MQRDPSLVGKSNFKLTIPNELRNIKIYVYSLAVGDENRVRISLTPNVLYVRSLRTKVDPLRLCCSVDEADDEVMPIRSQLRCAYNRLYMRCFVLWIRDLGGNHESRVCALHGTRS